MEFYDGKHKTKSFIQHDKIVLVGLSSEVRLFTNGQQMSTKKLSVESLTKKLKSVANTQDSIPMFSLWIIHHKAHHQLIVNTWLEILKNSKPKHRLTLWYLANDVIQCCHRKKADVFRESFANVLPEAIAFLRDKSILPGVERVLKVWSGRNMYDTELIDQLHAALLTNRPPDKLRQKLLVEYKPAKLVDSIISFKKSEDTLHFGEKQMINFRVDASSSDDIHKLKDKVGGEKFSRNFEESAMSMERFIQDYEKYIDERKTLIEMLSKGGVFYRAQYHEAKIVVNAYQSFDMRVRKMKRFVDQLKLKLSPTMSPAGTRIMDQSQEADMEMSDSDQELGSKPSKIVAVNTSVTRAISSESSSTIPKIQRNSSASQQGSGFVNRPGMRGASSASILSSMQESFTRADTNSSTVPISINGITPSDLGNRSPLSASPPSPTGSPELNISSPPRQQSLESRLADIFSGSAMKADAIAGSESDAESIPATAGGNSPPQSTTKELNFFSPKVTTSSEIAPAVTTAPPAENRYSASSQASETYWQNTIPVIGGNRSQSSSQAGGMFGNLRLIVDGGSTPLQDEPGSGRENYLSGSEEHLSPSMNGRAIRRQQSDPSALPPPAFSGDALNFLTKFMGQKTNTTLVEPEIVNRPASAPWDTNSGKGVEINWNSLEEHIGGEKGMSWLRECVSSAIGTARSSEAQAEKSNPSNTVDHDTDYRTVKMGSNNKQIPLIDDIGGEREGPRSADFNYHNESSAKDGNRSTAGVGSAGGNAAAVNQFSDISSGAVATGGKSGMRVGTEYIVEEEEIELDEDAADDVKKTEVTSGQESKPPAGELGFESKNHQATPNYHTHEHFQSGRPENPPRPERYTAPGHAGPRFQNRFSRPFPNRPPNYQPRGGEWSNKKRPFPDSRRGHQDAFPGRGRGHRPRPWNGGGGGGFRGRPRPRHQMYLEEEYYDRLYEELQPKMRRGTSREMYRMQY